MQVVFGVVGTGVLLAGIFKKLEESEYCHKAIIYFNYVNFDLKAFMVNFSTTIDLFLLTDNSVFAIFTLLSSLFAMCGASGCFGIVFSFTPEMFPTNLRYQGKQIEDQDYCIPPL